MSDLKTGGQTPCYSSEQKVVQLGEEITKLEKAEAPDSQVSSFVRAACSAALSNQPEPKLPPGDPLKTIPALTAQLDAARRGRDIEKSKTNHWIDRAGSLFNENTKLRSEIDALRAELEAVRTDLTYERDLLRAEVQAARAQLADLRAQLDAAQEELRVKTETISGMNTFIDKLPS